MSMGTEYDHSQPEVMLAYYRRLYPFKSIYNWLNHEHTPTRLFTQREFAFTLQGDVYLRYHSFAAAEELKKSVCDLNPTRFEIGPIYSARPRDKKSVRSEAFQPLLRELVFDIDMTDYDPIRTCCSEAGICKRCWHFIAVAVRVLDSCIRDQFGYQDLLWVYSGRRGIHLWISDKEAMELTDQERKALVTWMTVIQGGAESTRRPNVRVGTRPLPAPFQAVLPVLSETFSDLILADQDCFASKEGYEALLHLMGDEQVATDLRKLWEKDPNRPSEEKWQDFKNVVRATPKGSPRRTALQALMEDIVLYYTYPRLDAEVSKHRNHLLKAPFCVHPKTGRVCIPVDPQTVDEFDPETVPTVAQLLRELDSISPSEGTANVEHHADWEKTSLKPYVEMLNQHATRLMEKVRLEKRAKESISW